MKVCRCNRDWAGKECSVQRKSKLVAYTLSVFFGWLGLDRLYLGFYLLGFFKLFTFGFFGLGWIFDVVYISSGDVY